MLQKCTVLTGAPQAAKSSKTGLDNDVFDTMEQIARSLSSFILG
jgi:hypothetical protein